MNKLVRFYNQNRGFILIIMAVIALIIIIIQVLNSLVEQKNTAKLQNIENNVNSSTDINSATISKNNNSMITGEEVKNSKASEDTIKQFVKYCNEGKVSLAYDMLTDDCKSLIYPSLERFKAGYVDRIFKINRMYTLENWYSRGNFNTYYIKYTEDILASGNVNSSDNVGDYITVIKHEDENKINIGSFIKSDVINRGKTISNVTVTVYKIYYYLDYTVLEFKVKNETEDVIYLDTKEKVNTAYLYDTNSIKYEAMLNEKSKQELQVLRNMERSISVKFNKMYNLENRIISGVVFENVVIKSPNNVEEKNTIKFDISI